MEVCSLDILVVCLNISPGFKWGFLQRDESMRELWSDRQSCSHNVSQNKRICRFSDPGPGVSPAGGGGLRILVGLELSGLLSSLMTTQKRQRKKRQREKERERERDRDREKEKER